MQGKVEWGGGVGGEEGVRVEGACTENERGVSGSEKGVGR